MNFWPSASNFVYSETYFPKFTAQPDTVFSTPGLGHFVQDYELYVPLHSYPPDVKEVEKSIAPTSSGGFELNLPILPPPLTKKRRKIQKGDGKDKKTETLSERSRIESALAHPIKVIVSLKMHFSYFYL